MNIIYLAAYKAHHPKHNMIYQDINGERDLHGDMLKIDLKPYDVIIATPPCNYYSKARGNRKPSEYAENTKHLLPSIIKKCVRLKKPFIIESVINKVSMRKVIDNCECHYYEHGRHSYFTNVMFDPTGCEQHYDYKYGGYQINPKDNQGGQNVHNVIEYWLSTL